MTTQRTGRWTLAALAAPSVPLSALSLPLVVYLPEFYSNTPGLNLSVVGATFMLVRLLDIGFDPVMGGVMDRTRTRWGRFRPWLAVGAPMIMLAVFMLFMAKPGVGQAYLAGWLALAYAGWSVMTLAQLALAASISPDYNERSRIYSWWQGAFLIGLILIMLLPKLMLGRGASAASSMQMMAWLVILFAPLTAGSTLLRVREPTLFTARQQVGLSQYFGLLRRAAVRRVLGSELLLGLASGITSTLILFFFTRTKSIDRADVGLLLIVNASAALLATPIWAALAGRLGKHRTLAVSSISYVVFQASLAFMPSGSLVFAAICTAGTGMSYSAASLLPRAMLADAGDEERLETGVDRTGLLYALLIGIWKIGQALSVGIMYVALDRFGFRAGEGAVNPPTALDRLKLLHIALPCLLNVAAVAAILRYPLTAARHAEIRAKLAERDRATSELLDVAPGPAKRGKTKYVMTPQG